jgi:outer membrane beta-barrel protein
MKRLGLVAVSACTFILSTSASALAQSTDSETDSEARATEADAEDEEDTSLADRIKSVQRKVFLKRRRLELSPLVGLSVNDAFHQHVTLGGSLAYHLVDALSIEARGAVVAVAAETNAVRFVRQETDSLLDDAQRQHEYHGELDLLWSPIYGKFSLFGEAILHFDTYIAVGGGVFGTDAGAHGAANMGIGQRWFLTEWLVLRFEYRNYFFAEERNDETNLRTPGMFNFMFSFFLPPKFEYEYQ